MVLGQQTSESARVCQSPIAKNGSLVDKVRDDFAGFFRVERKHRVWFIRKRLTLRMVRSAGVGSFLPDKQLKANAENNDKVNLPAQRHPDLKIIPLPSRDR